MAHQTKNYSRSKRKAKSHFVPTVAAHSKTSRRNSRRVPERSPPKPTRSCEEIRCDPTDDLLYYCEDKVEGLNLFDAAIEQIEEGFSKSAQPVLDKINIYCADEYVASLGNFTSTLHQSGELRLMAAVLRTAVKSLHTIARARLWRARDPLLRFHALSSMAWLFSDDVTYLYSAQSICDAMNIDVSRLRTNFVRWGRLKSVADAHTAIRRGASVLDTIKEHYPKELE